MESEVFGSYKEQSEYADARKRLEAIETFDPFMIAHEALAGFVAGANGSYVGLVMESIEALGLPEKQETAAKKLLKQRMYDLMADLQGTISAEFDLYYSHQTDWDDDNATPCATTGCQAKAALCKSCSLPQLCEKDCGCQAEICKECAKKSN